MLDHEYAILGGVNRSKVGRYIYAAASALSAAIVFVLLSLVDIAKIWHINANIPPGVLALCGAATVYLLLYALFDKYLWRFNGIQRAISLPDLSGKWTCEGLTVNSDPQFGWNGAVTIVQSWDKIRVRIETENSYSDSQAAALQFDTAAGYRLLYHYINFPKIGRPDLNAHHGFGELLFSTDLSTASGEYFNGRGRNTYGTLKLTREEK